MTTPAMPENAPGAAEGRIESLDVLRGLGILGILMVNAVAFAWPWQAYQNPMNSPFPFDGGEVTAWFITHVFFELKFITLFSMLFGVSLFIVGGERSDKDRGRLLRRCLLWMAVFGAIHGALIWFGDILLTYALTGLVVLLCRSWRAVVLLRVGISLFLVGSLAFFMLSLLAFVPESAMSAQDVAAIGKTFWWPEAADLLEITAGFRGAGLEAVLSNIEVWSETLLAFPVTLFWRTAGVMMIGLALFKWGFFEGRAPRSAYVTLIIIGVVAVGLLAAQAFLMMAEGFRFPHAAGLYQLTNYFLSPFVTLLYVSLIVLGLKAGGLGVIGQALGAVGRMAFSNYIAQSLIMTGLFYGWGLGFFGEAPRTTLVAIVIGIWALQLLWSPLYLRHFRYGPLEWVWRSLTLGRAVPIRAREAAAVINPAEAR